RIEKNISFKKFAHSRDLVGNIPPALLMTIYNRKVKIEEQLISSYIYMKEHNIIKIKSDQIVGDYDKELESHENYLISYFLGMIDQNTYIDNYKYYIYKDLKTNKDIKKLIDNSYNNTHFLEIFIGWIMITQLILISTLSSVGNIGTYVIIAFACPFIVIPLYIIFKAKYPFVKTKKGLELEAKLNKIKQYLNNADNIKDKKNAKFYEEYILYSILFNDTDELNKECRKEYNNITKYINNSTNQLLYNKLHISISKEKIIGLIITFVVVTYMSWIFSTISLSIAIISWIIFTLILVTCILLNDYHNK
ncbi:MAG: DUF2207 domain-containing protein, partial [Bacilli bacterium]|nr:DUF2207 domain-containing protein [Bacilli bacterium]